jgi:hypothetical protein
MAENETPTADEIAAFQFMNLVMQTANMAMIFLGKVAHPETGKVVTDLDAARMFIDQLEMLAVKTKGNLNADEKKVLNDSLTSLRMMFVETAAAARSSQIPAENAGKTASQSPASADQPAEEPQAGPDSGAQEADNKKKFVKKY